MMPPLLSSKRRKSLPHIGQLKSGEWCVFNMPGTELWDATFSTREAALNALAVWHVKSILKKGEDK